MATQTIEIKSEHLNEANTVCRAYNPVTEEFVQASEVLAAPVFGVIYRPVFTDLPAGEYFFMLESSAGYGLNYGYATVTAETGTFKLTGNTAAEQAAEAAAVDAALELYFQTSTPAKGSLSILSVIELIAAAVAGKSSAPSATTEKFVHLDGVSDAFTVTYDAENYRTSVSVE